MQKKDNCCVLWTLNVFQEVFVLCITSVLEDFFPWLHQAYCKVRQGRHKLSKNQVTTKRYCRNKQHVHLQWQCFCDDLSQNSNITCTKMPVYRLCIGRTVNAVYNTAEQHSSLNSWFFPTVTYVSVQTSM